jgi:hypothetical protein
MFLIVAEYMGNSEVIDVADNKKEAKLLEKDYNWACGQDSNISIVPREEK